MTEPSLLGPRPATLRPVPPQTPTPIRSRIYGAVEALGGRLDQVIRTRMFIIDITKAAEATAVHGEFFRDIRPVCTMVEVSRLIDDRALIEIEADALIV